MTDRSNKHNKKQIIDYNLPFQKPLRLSFKQGNEESKHTIIDGGDQNQNQDAQSRSNSIKGRKLSFCDAQLIVSQQQTLQSIHNISVQSKGGDRPNKTFRDYSDHQPQPQPSSNNQRQQQYASFLVNSSSNNSILNISTPSTIQYSHAMNRGQNPRQSKERSKNKRHHLPVQGVSQNRSLLKIIKPSFKEHLNSVKKQQQEKSPNQNKSLQQISNFLQQEQKNQRSGQKQKQHSTSFQLTFSKNKDPTPNKVISEHSKIELKFNKNGLLNIVEQRIKKPSNEDNSIIKKRTNSGSATRRSKSPLRKSSASPPRSHSKKRIAHEILMAQHQQQQQENKDRSYIGSGQKDGHIANNNNIDKLIKMNIKKKAEQVRKQHNILKLKMLNQFNKKQLIEDHNKDIRQKNLVKILNPIGKNKQENYMMQEQPSMIRNKSKSPIRWQQEQKENIYKNQNMPLLKADPKRKKEQLGLEIFDVKRELGLGNYMASNPQTERNKLQKHNELIEQQYPDIVNRPSKQQLHKPELAKLVTLQCKKRSEKEKQERKDEWEKLDRVMQNLKNLNKVIESTKIKKVQSSKHFKTVQEINDQQAYSQKQKHQQSQHELSTHQQENNNNNQKSASRLGKSKSKKSISSRRQTLPPEKSTNNLKVIYSFVKKHASPQKKASPNKSFGKKKKSIATNKDKIIAALLKQLAQQQSEISDKKLQEGNKSVRLSRPKSSSKLGKVKKSVDSPLRIKNKRKSLKIIQQKSQEQSPQQISPPKNGVEIGIFQSSQQDSIQHQIESIEVDSDNLQIDDDMMIFCVLTTAASIIQRSYRAHLLKKSQLTKEIQKIIIQDQINDLYGVRQHDHFQDSALLENRIIPSKATEQDQHHVNSFSQQQNNGTNGAGGQRKQPKHTFSFGTYDESQMGNGAAAITSSLQASSAQQHQPFTEQHIYEQNTDLIAKSKALSNQAEKQLQTQTNQSLESGRLETSPVDDRNPSFFNNNQNPISAYPPQMTYQQQQQQQLKQKQQQLQQQQQQPTAKPVEDIDKLLKINDKFKYSLRNIAERQKHTTLIDHLKNKRLDSDRKNSSSINKETIEETRPKTVIQHNQQLHQQIPQPLQQNKMSTLQTNVLKQQQQQQEEYEHMLSRNALEESLKRRSQLRTISNNNNNNNNQSQLDSSLNKQNSDRSMLSNTLRATQQLQEQEPSRISINIEGDDSKEEDSKMVEHVSSADDQEAANNSCSNMSSLLQNGEQTDKIINYSPLTTNEQQLEAVVDESRTFNNDESLLNGVMNESNFQHSSKVDESHQQLDSVQVLFSEKEEHSNSFNGEEDSRDYGGGHGHGNQMMLVKSEESENNYSQHKKQSINQSKPMLRLMFGDEQFIKDHGDLGPLSIESNSYRGGGSGPSSYRLMHSENPYFLATNASIFDRNPFKEFTTNKLNDVLSGKDMYQLASLKEDALKFQEKLEKGFINRMEHKEELSPKASQRKKYELECWVTSERKKVSHQREHPLNVFDLEEERKEAAMIIAQVNKKAKEIKSKLQLSKMAEAYSSHQEKSLSKLDLSEDILEERRMPMIIVDTPTKTETREDDPTMLLEISFEEEEESAEDNQKVVLGEGNDYTFTQQERGDIKQTNIDHHHSLRVDELTATIFRELLMAEASNMFPKRLPEIQNIDIQEINLQFYVEENKNTQKAAVKQLGHFQNEEQEKFEELNKQKSKWVDIQEQQQHQEQQQQLLQPIEKQQYKIENKIQIVPQLLPVIEIPNSSSQLQQSQQNQMGIVTTDESIYEYIEDIFNQITQRKDQFLQAFLTPLYKNPLEILANLQRPEFGDLEMTNDLSNSMSCILNVQLYLTLEKARENVIHEALEQIKKQNLLLLSSSQLLLTEDEMTDMISEAQHIHNKIIFDCVNEALNLNRPYNYQGEPMPWSNKPRKNLIFMFENPDCLDQILFQVKSKVMQWAKTKAGALPPKIFDKYSSEYYNQMDEESFAQQREKCLAQLLAQDLVEGEGKWLDYEMEEAQVKIDLSDIVLEHLVGETCVLLNNIQASRFDLQAQYDHNINDNNN